MKKFTSLLSLVLGVLTFVACDDTTSADNSSDFTAKVDTVYSVLKDTVFVMEKDTVVLDNRDTVVLNQRDTIVRLDTVARMDTVVLNKKDTLVLNHVDTVVVIDTVLGLNDDHCFVDNGFGANALIVCGEDSTWVSNMMWCGTFPYNPKEQFCFDSQPYGLCGGESYDPTQYVCGPEEKILSRCGTEGYDPETQFCINDKGRYYVYKRCDGMRYAPYGEFYTEFIDSYYLCSEDNRLQTLAGNYRLIIRGSLFWMADNLKNLATDRVSYCGGAIGSEDDFIDGDCATYGSLYASDDVASLGDKLCPFGWRLPTIEELSAEIGSVIEESWKEIQFSGYVATHPLRAVKESFWIWSGTTDVVSGQNQVYAMRYNSADGWEKVIGDYSTSVYGSIRCVKRVNVNYQYGLLY